MTEPLHVAFEVRCVSDHAFEVWTTRIATWWPADHSVSGNPETIVLEPRVGGRMYERSPDGTEHDWGEITLWEPPRGFAYRWHLGRDRGAATDVQIRFEELGPTTTRIVIEHYGWDHLGVGAENWRDRNRVGWETLLPHFRTAIERGAI
ncbi:MAG TPA: hypothetical protein VIJ34_04490 [Acidimicrobiales bacterium]